MGLNSNHECEVQIAVIKVIDSLGAIDLLIIIFLFN
jgi:hypothetical protein